jgi:hypothetical protein
VPGLYLFAPVVIVTEMCARATPEGRAACKRRAPDIEGIYASIEEIIGLRRFSMRGLAQATGAAGWHADARPRQTTARSVKITGSAGEDPWGRA